MTSTLPTGRSINLQLGWPSPSLFPSAELNTSANAVFTNPNVTSAALVYGPNRGYVPLRKEVARWLSSVYFDDNKSVEEDRVCIAGGASQNLANCLLRFTDPTYTRHIWMVEPTYFLACPVFEDCGYARKMRGVPEDDQGIDLAFLRAALAQAEAETAEGSGKPDKPQFKTAANGYEKIYKHVIYLVPTFSNPSGKTMSLQHRYNLVRLAIEHDALIISDDVYDFLYWPKEQGIVDPGAKLRIPPRLVDINREIDPDSKWGNTMSNGSFSKIVAPGVRVSWAEATAAFATFLANTGSTWSGGNPGHVSSTFIHGMLSSGALEKHIRETLIPCYAARYHTMISAIKEHLEPLGVKIDSGVPYNVTGPPHSASNAVKGYDHIELTGGFFVLINLPSGLPSASVLGKIALEQHELKFATGNMFVVKGDNESQNRASLGYGNCVRLCWAFHDEKEIVEGMVRMRDLFIEQRGKN